MRAYVLAEFTTPEAMVEGARAVREAGFVDLDTHSPFPVAGAADAIAAGRSPVPILCGLFGGIGAVSGYLLQWWCNGVNYPLIVGNRPPLGPLSLWLPHFIPITFELGVLFGSFGAFFGFFALARLPRPYHPIFALEEFRTATLDRFWVSVATMDLDRDIGALTRLCSAAGATRVLPVTDAAGEPERFFGTEG